MKKLLLITAIALASFFKVSAQTEQGNILLGGAISYESDKNDIGDDDDDDADENLTIMPMIGYFVKNNLALGAGVGYAYHKAPSGAKESYFTVMPFGRLYKSLGSEQFKIFGQLAVPLQFGSFENADGDDIGESTSIGVSLSPGFSFFPTKKFGIELSFTGIEFSNYKEEDNDGDTVVDTNHFSIGADFFSPQLGLLFYF